VKITQGVFLEVLREGKLIKASFLREEGEESGEDEFLDRFRPYVLRLRDVELGIEDLDLSDYRPDVVEVFRVLKDRVGFGRVITYGELGRLVGRHPRFVAYCMKINRFPLIIPCHRVVSKVGLGGFSYGKEMKRRLLLFEGSLELVGESV